MAHLNVRENRLEATIAYVGAERAGKATNFAQLAGDQRAGLSESRRAPELLVGQLLKLAYLPHARSQGDESALRLELVAAHGATPAHVQREIAGSADGVVFVVDSEPAALAQNRRLFDELRELLGQQRARGRPVVVQLNKRDLAHALSPSELAAALELGDLPTVLSCAAKGEGVVSTLERVISGLEGGFKAAQAAGAPLAQAPRSEGNPLLASLRQLLQQTVAEHVEALGDRLAAQIEARLSPVEHLLRAAAENACLDEEEAARTRACLDLLKERASDQQIALHTLQATLETLGRDLRGKRSRGGS